MTELLNIGFGNLVNTDKIEAIVSPDSAPAKRLVQRAKKEERAVDATQGRKTRSIIILERDTIVLSSLGPDTLAGRFHELSGGKEEE